jgi:D-cysteine desulfhydrase
MSDNTIAQPPLMLDLGAAPTPLHRLRGLQAQFERGPELLAKREDLCGVALGGSKVRKLRALLAEAEAQRATVVVTTGAVQSNHCAMTAVAAATRGLRTELLLTGPDPCNRVGNLLIAQVAGGIMRFLGECSRREQEDLMTLRIAELRSAGEIPYPIPLGGSTPLGTAAYATAVDEIATQLAGHAPTHLVVAAGSLGTMAGLVLGVWAAGLDCAVHGYTVLWPAAEATARLDDLLEVTRRRYFPQAAPRPNYQILGNQRGDGYGVPTTAGRAAARLAARHDGLLLDPTYTAKAMAGIIQGIRDGLYQAGDRVLFVHTGGAAGLLATDADTAAGVAP